MRLIVITGLGLTLLGPVLSRDGRAQARGEAGVARAAQGPGQSKPGASKNGSLTPYGSRDIRGFTAAQKQKQEYSRTPSTPSPVDKRSRAAVFAKGVRDYYPAARSNQSKNSNVIDPKTLCVPGRRALLQR